MATDEYGSEEFGGGWFAADAQRHQAGDGDAHTSPPTKDESFVVLRGKVKVSAYYDDDLVIKNVVLCKEGGGFGVDMRSYRFCAKT